MQILEDTQYAYYQDVTAQININQQMAEANRQWEKSMEKRSSLWKDQLMNHQLT